jgi:haloalkane dehalogenase
MPNKLTVLRTPDECFRDLPDFAFAPNYFLLNDQRFGALRMHYIDEGPRDAPVVLMLHGEPTWSFLYRKIIAPVAAAGYRAVAPDFIGFGRSDKLVRRADYSYQAFVDWMTQFIQALDLRNITLVCQDWGGPIGLRLLAAMPERFSAVLAANTLLPTCEAPPRGIAGWPGAIIETWVQTSKAADDLPVSEIVAGTCVRRPDANILRGYDAPFPSAAHKAGVLEFPSLIPIAEDMPGVSENRRAWQVLERFDKPFLTAFSDSDPSTKAWEQVFRERVPGAAGQPHTEIIGAGHFLQEEKGEALAAVLLDFLQRNKIDPASR